MYFHDIPANGIGYLFSFLKVFNKIVKISFAGEGGGKRERKVYVKFPSKKIVSIDPPSVRRIFRNYYSLNKRLNINVAAEK